MACPEHPEVMAYDAKQGFTQAINYKQALLNLPPEALVCWDRDVNYEIDPVNWFVGIGNEPTFTYYKPGAKLTTFLEFVADPFPHWRSWDESPTDRKWPMPHLPNSYWADDGK
jgi:hypothetical protein